MAFAITKPLQQHKDDAIADINDEAGKRILARYPLHKQANMTTRAIELQSLNMMDSAEWADIGAAWDWIKSIIKLSNTHNGNVDSSTDVVSIRSEVAEFKQILETV